MLRVGLIGFGLAGQSFHGPIIRGTPGLELACILERNTSLASQKYPGVRIARNLDQFLEDEQLRLCVVATPNDTHFELARRCLLAGRDVIVDKPFTTTSQQARELIELAGREKRLLTVYQNRRRDGDFQTVRKLVKSGILGDMTEYEARFDRYRLEPRLHSWRERGDPGGGVLFDLGPHLIDQALVLFGSPQAITAKVWHQREGSVVDDAFDIFLEYPGFRAGVRSKTLAYAPGPHFLLHGMKGSFVKYGMDPQEAILRNGGPPEGTDWGANWGRDPEALWGTLSLADGSTPRKVPTEIGDYRDYYANVRDAVLKGEPLDVEPEQGYRIMRALELARQSSTEGRTIPW